MIKQHADIAELPWASRSSLTAQPASAYPYPLPQCVMLNGKGCILPSVPVCIFHECFGGGKRLARIGNRI